MDEERRQELTVQRFMQWESDLALVYATPIIVIAVSHAPGPEGQMHVFVPMHDPLERQLMIETLRKIAHDLEAEGR